MHRTRRATIATPSKESQPIHLSHLSLINFRNYERLEFDLQPGMVLLQGRNGQGKSNFLEAIYILAIAKSPRASADRELVRQQSPQTDPYSQISAVVQRNGEAVRVQIDLRSLPADPGREQPANAPGDRQREPAPNQIQKQIRVNGVPRRASDMIGSVNAVMFSAHDMELVYGSPSARRRYLDIMISQTDSRYLRAAQRYQRVTYQRNHLLRMVREGRSRPEELTYWDGQLVTEGTYILARRLETARVLSEVAASVHGELTESESLRLGYRASVPAEAGQSEKKLADALLEAIESRREREIAQGVTLSGPHRDDLQVSIDGMDATVYASRGQSRTAVLAMKLAEAAYLRDRRQVEPILLLDDVLSELDAPRRAQVLERASQYSQCFITTTGLESIELELLSEMSRFVVERGTLRPSG